MSESLDFFVDDAPLIAIQLIQDDVDENGNPIEVSPDVTGWTGMLRLVPRQSTVPTITVALTISDAGLAIFSWQVPGGYLPGEAKPNVTIVNSFSKPAVYDGTAVVRTVNPDGSAGEVLTSEAFVVTVNAR